MTQRKINKKIIIFFMYLHADLASGKKFKMISGDQFPVCFVVYKVISYLQNKKRS